MQSITGGERIARLLASEQVEVVFGIIDGTYFGLTRALAAHGIRLVTPRHETTALHMAGAYSRLTGRLGVCLASNGPGAANALPGVVVEQGEGNRVLLITSWRRSQIASPQRAGAYQLFDQPGVIAGAAKWSRHVPSFDRIGELLTGALRESWSGRPGLVHICVHEDIINGEFATSGADDPSPAASRRTAAPAADPRAVSRAADLLCAARAPVIHAGSGVLWAGAENELAEVARALAAPVTTSWAARDTVDERSDFAVPMPFVDLVNRVRAEADVVLSVGSRLGETDWWAKAPYWGRPGDQRFIQVDIDESVIGMRRPVEAGIVADARQFLTALRDELSTRDLSEVRERAGALQADRLHEIEAARAELDAARATTGAPMHSSHLAPVCQAVAGDDAIWVVDGGNTAVWASTYLQVRRPRSVLGTWKFGMLGAGPGQALGAKVACPDRPVVCIIGDGAMGFHALEIETAVRHELPVVFVVACDRQWGMVKVNQEFALDADTLLTEGALAEGTLTNTDLGEIRWDLLAQAAGALGERASTREELEVALERSLGSGRCAVIHVDVDPVAHKFAPNLVTFKAMHEEPAG